jgi:hypothetical protein
MKALVQSILSCAVLTASLYAGEAYFQDSDGSRKYYVKNRLFPNDQRAFTGRYSTKVRLSKDVVLEVGKRSVLWRCDEGDDLTVMLIKGRVRVKSDGPTVNVKTPVADVLTQKGVSDVILANLNTMAVNREGKGLKVSTTKRVQDVSVEKYVLVTIDGALVINEWKSDEIDESGDKS